MVVEEGLRNRRKRQNKRKKIRKQPENFRQISLVRLTRHQLAEKWGQKKLYMAFSHVLLSPFFCQPPRDRKMGTEKIEYGVFFCFSAPIFLPAFLTQCYCAHVSRTTPRNSRTSATASLANCFTFAKSPASNNSGLTIQLPPQATTCGKTRYWPMFLVSIPPVGMNRMSLYGAQIACKNFTPPIGSAGKNFNTSTPFDKAISISVGVQTPGKIVTPFDKQWSTTARFVPGETINSAPALIAVSACSVVSAVPAPRNISGKRERICAMASAAAVVRNVISAHGNPPSSSASASGKASSSFGRLTTGTIPIPRARSTMLIEDPLWKISVMNRTYRTCRTIRT